MRKDHEMQVQVIYTNGVAHVSPVMVFVPKDKERDYEGYETMVPHGKLLREKRRRLGQIGFEQSQKDSRWFGVPTHGRQKPRYKDRRHGRLPTSFVALMLSSNGDGKGREIEDDPEALELHTAPDHQVACQQ